MGVLGCLLMYVVIVMFNIVKQKIVPWQNFRNSHAYGISEYKQATCTGPIYLEIVRVTLTV